jgi:large subunit ribosomal protein L1
MAKHGKKYEAALEKVDDQRLYTVEEASSLLKEVAFANFDETVELHARLGIDPRQADQAVRSNDILPHGSGKRSACSSSPPARPSVPHWKRALTTPASMST